MDTCTQLSTLPQDVKQEVLELTKRKKAGKLGNGTRNPVLDRWIAESFVVAEEYCKSLPTLKEPPTTEFNTLFYQTVQQYSTSSKDSSPS